MCFLCASDPLCVSDCVCDVPLSMYVSLSVTCVQVLHYLCVTVFDCLDVVILIVLLCLYGLSNWFLIHALLVFQCRLPIYGDVFRDANHLGRFEQAGIQRRALVRLLSY